MPHRLDGKVAVITGAARGLGRAYALEMARQGARVVAVDVMDPSETVAALKALGGEALDLQRDVSVESETRAIAEETMDAFGRIDILVNNAAVSPEQPFEEVTFEDWRGVLSVNTDGPFLCARAVVPHMKHQKWGRIINVASATWFKSIPNLCHYVTSKAAVIGLTRALAAELGEYGITVNAISPGLTRTERTASIPDEFWNFQISMQSVKRRGTPEDLVGAVVFLASDESAFITGQTLSVCGGFVNH